MVECLIKEERSTRPLGKGPKVDFSLGFGACDKVGTFRLVLFLLPVDENENYNNILECVRPNVVKRTEQITEHTSRLSSDSIQIVTEVAKKITSNFSASGT